jgi:hypothetical protein
MAPLLSTISFMLDQFCANMGLCQDELIELLLFWPLPIQIVSLRFLEASVGPESERHFHLFVFNHLQLQMMRTYYS